MNIYDNMSFTCSKNENYLDERRREIHKTPFVFNNYFFPKTLSFMRHCGRICWSRTGHI